MKKHIITILLLLSSFQLMCLDFNNEIDRWNNRELSSKEFLSILDNLESDLSIGSRDEFYYNKSRLNLYRGIINLQLGNKEESIRLFETVITESKKALEIKERSDYYRVLSEAGSYLMLQKGIGYIIQHSQEVDSNAKKALELDPDNVKATLIVAGGLINAPALFGGNKKKGITTLKKALNVPDITNEEKFNILIMLTEATEDKKYLDQAKKIYPNNKKAVELLASLIR